mmetsp:Transcript_9678/g.15286  ORF Transcript_9678/g.15286 Transcript_9678/m.15286 type:complete len:110 (-) Transcript_9678:170-499(-)
MSSILIPMQSIPAEFHCCGTQGAPPDGMWRCFDLPFLRARLTRSSSGCDLSLYCFDILLLVAADDVAAITAFHCDSVNLQFVPNRSNIAPDPDRCRSRIGCETNMLRVH